MTKLERTLRNRIRRNKEPRYVIDRLDKPKVSKFLRLNDNERLNVGRIDQKDTSLDVVTSRTTIKTPVKLVSTIMLAREAASLEATNEE